MACSCAEIPSIEDAYFMTQVIFSGTVIQIENVSLWETVTSDKRMQVRKEYQQRHPNAAFFDNAIIQKVSIKRTKVYKGENINDTLIIFTPRSGAACGFTWFKVGEDFTIYASIYNNYLYNYTSFTNLKALQLPNSYWTNQCTRTFVYREQEAETLLQLSRD